MVAQASMAVHGVEEAEADMVEAHLHRLIHGDLGLPQDLDRLHHLREGVDTGRALRPTPVVGQEARHHRGGEEEDDTTMITIDDVAPAATATIAMPGAEAAEVDRGTEEATVEWMMEAKILISKPVTTDQSNQIHLKSPSISHAKNFSVNKERLHLGYRTRGLPAFRQSTGSDRRME